MPNTVLIGSQWGDEGKGKIIDVLSRDVDWIVRYQGGNNAGHTVEIGDQKYVLHLVPSGILTEGKKCVIGNGVVVDPVALVDELKGVVDRGISIEGRFFISDRCHIVFPYHGAIDSTREQGLKEGEKIGTTKRGIGPSYGDKAARVGLRMADMIDPDFPELLKSRVERNNKILAALGADELDYAELASSYKAASDYLAPFVTDTITLLNDAIRSGDTVLFEGAQGTMLDIDYGTYPFVTSSSASAGGACTGAGVAPQRIHEVVGVTKAYTTRVGEGPFPTELLDESGQKLRDEGHEYGATTGRPRRCGWFDAVVARYSAAISGIDYWALTKLDVLDKFETIKICTSYQCDGEVFNTVPANIRMLEKCEPVYEDLEGWMQPTTDIAKFADLPAQAKAYVRHLADITRVPVGILSVGPNRASTMDLRGVDIED